MSTRLNRRAILAGAAAAAVPVPAIAIPEADPIYAVIEAYKVTWAAFLARAEYEDGLAAKGIKLDPAPDGYRTPELTAAVNASIAARRTLAETSPTTLKGLLAVLRLVHEESEMLGDYTFDDHEECIAFIKSLKQGVTRLAEAVQS